MAVLFEVPQALCRFTDGQTELELFGATTGAVLSSLWERYPGLESRVLDRRGQLYPYLLLLHNGHSVARNELADRLVQPGDLLELLALAEGG